MDECHLFNELNMNSLEEELKEEINYSCDSIFTAADNRNNVGNLSSFEENNTQHANSSSEKPTSLFSSYTLSFEDCTTVPNVPNKTCQYHGEHEHLKETREETHTRKCKRDGTKTFPHVEARVSAKDVLIRVICDKEIDIVTKLLSKLAAHNLSIVCSNVVPFGNSTLKISMIAKVDREFNMAMDDLVKKLNEDLLKLFLVFFRTLLLLCKLVSYFVDKEDEDVET
ncbi:hypothetical protein JHK85_007290 [Glycine max]|nr:hypothetical protein JHK85_007290 [Glycine max]KAG5071874.1 hypothetical protein JHK86_007085 [Glycine max]